MKWGGRQDKENPTRLANRLQILAQRRGARDDHEVRTMCPHLTSQNGVSMQTVSINRLFRGGALKRDIFGVEVFRPGKSLNLARALKEDMLEGRRDGRAKSNGGPTRAGYGKKLASLIGPSRRVARRTWSQGASAGFDPRQRAIVKIHYFSHAGGGGAALRAHARYVARDAVARETQPGDVPQSDPAADNPEAKPRAHTKYLERESRAAFYDAVSDSVEGAERAASWARSDRRHFRLILAPEGGTRLADLKSYTREVMHRAEIALGSRLEWVAVDHWDTDNPHTHIILRGVREDGRDLIIPREFVQHGFRSAARDVATERLGPRTREDDRLALHREVRAHRPTRLDQWIAERLDEQGKVRIADLRAPNGDPAATEAMKGRAHELRRLGLAAEVRRNVLQFGPNWRDGLKALELHLDIRKALMQSRAVDATRARETAKSISTLLRGPDR